MTRHAQRPEGHHHLATAATVGSVLATLVTGVACAGPLVAILLGISGFGFLVQYAYLRVPATILTVALLAVGFYLVYRPGCSRFRRGRRAALWLAAAFAVAVNVFEYVLFPYLA